MTQTHEYFRFESAVAEQLTGSGIPELGEVVEFIWDNSSGVGSITAGMNNFDTTINAIDIVYRSSSQFMLLI